MDELAKALEHTRELSLKVLVESDPASPSFRIAVSVLQHLGYIAQTIKTEKIYETPPGIVYDEYRDS